MNLSSALALSDLYVGNAAIQGEGLDLDLDPMTCLPGTLGVDCFDGVENEISELQALVEPMLRAGLLPYFQQTGNILLGLENYTAEGVMFDMPFYFGKKDPNNAGCDTTTQTCTYYVPRPTSMVSAFRSTDSTMPS